MQGGDRPLEGDARSADIARHRSQAMPKMPTNFLSRICPALMP